MFQVIVLFSAVNCDLKCEVVHTASKDLHVQKMIFLVVSKVVH